VWDLPWEPHAWPGSVLPELGWWDTPCCSLNLWAHVQWNCSQCWAWLMLTGWEVGWCSFLAECRSIVSCYYSLCSYSPLGKACLELRYMWHHLLTTGFSVSPAAHLATEKSPTSPRREGTPSTGSVGSAKGSCRHSVGASCRPQSQCWWRKVSWWRTHWMSWLGLFLPHFPSARWEVLTGRHRTSLILTACPPTRHAWSTLRDLVREWLGSPALWTDCSHGHPVRVLKGISLLTFFFEVLGYELRAYTLTHSTSPIFVMGFFQDRVLQTICPGWLPTVILLIFAFWVARITGVSHWCLALTFF
jgi:hypothetical protein